MIRENAYTGEPMYNIGSPFTSEQEAEMNAAIGQAIYGNPPPQQPVMQQPYNYNMMMYSQPQQQQISYYPYQLPFQQQYQQPQAAYYQYPPNPSQPQRSVNPAFDLLREQQYQQQYYQPQPAMVNNNSYMQDLNPQQPQQGQFNNPYFNANPMYAQALNQSIQQNNNGRIPVAVQGYGVTPQPSGIGYGTPTNPATFGETPSFYNPYFYGMDFGRNMSSNEELKTYVEPLRPNGEYLPFTDQEDRLNAIFEKEYHRMVENDDFYGNNFGSNYYGSPFAMSSRSSQLERDLAELARKNRENRKALDIRLSKLAHGFQNDGVTDEDIEKMYNGYVVNTGIRAASYNRRAALSMMVPVSDNHEYYMQLDRMVTDNFYKTLGVSEHCTMKEFFDNIGAYGYQLALIEEKKKRMETKQYDKDTFAYVVRKKAIENHIMRYGNKNIDYLILNADQVTPAMIQNQPEGFNHAFDNLAQQQLMLNRIKQEAQQGQDTPVDVNQIRSILANFPTLSTATVSEDGTINIDYKYEDYYKTLDNYDREKDAEDPNYMKNFIDEYEADYKEKEQAFADTIFAEKSIGPVYFPPKKKPKPNKNGEGGS